MAAEQKPPKPRHVSIVPQSFMQHERCTSSPGGRNPHEWMLVTIIPRPVIVGNPLDPRNPQQTMMVPGEYVFACKWCLQIIKRGAEGHMPAVIEQPMVEEHTNGRGPIINLPDLKDTLSASGSGDPAGSPDPAE